MAKELEFAAAAAEDAWRHELAVILEPWLRRRLNHLQRVPGIEEGLGTLEDRVRHAVTLAHRYRLMRHELCGDRHWTGRPQAPWWWPDHNLAARSPFNGYAEGTAPGYALILTDHLSGNHRTGELTVAISPPEAPGRHGFHIIDHELRLHDGADQATDLAVRAGLIALDIQPASL